MNEAVQTGLTLPVAMVTSALFLSSAAVVIVFLYLRYRFQKAAISALSNSLDSNSMLAPDIAKRLGLISDLRKGVLSLARSAGCVLLGLAIGNNPNPVDANEAQALMWILIGLSAFPGLSGLTLVGFHFIEAKSNPR